MSDSRTMAAGVTEREVSQAGKLEEAGPFSVLKCPCVARTDLEKHWACLLICSGRTYRAGHRPRCLAPQECPLGLAQLAPTSGASPGLSWPCSVFCTGGLSLADFTQSAVPDPSFLLSLSSLCQVFSLPSGSHGVEWSRETPLGGWRTRSTLWSPTLCLSGCQFLRHPCKTSHGCSGW